MNPVFISLLISLLAALCVWGVGRRDPGGRPWLTVLCLGVLLLLPVLALLPKWHVDLLGTVRGVAVTQSSIPWWLGLWVAGAALMLVRVCVNHIALRKWVRDSFLLDDASWKRTLSQSAKKLHLRVLPELRLKDGLSSPVVAGVCRPVILIPRHGMQWSDETRGMAILHELGHLQRKDLWVRFAADIACALHWYNPLVWWMRAKLLSQCEYACDTHVVAAGVDPKSYARALCDVVEAAINSSGVTARPFGVCAMADHAPLKVRVARLVNGPRPVRPWVAVIAAVLTTATALGLSVVRPAIKQDRGGSSSILYTQEEIDLRHSANPFPGNE